MAAEGETTLRKLHTCRALLALLGASAPSREPPAAGTAGDRRRLGHLGLDHLGANLRAEVNPAEPADHLPLRIRRPKRCLQGERLHRRDQDPERHRSEHRRGRQTAGGGPAPRRADRRRPPTGTGSSPTTPKGRPSGPTRPMMTDEPPQPLHPARRRGWEMVSPVEKNGGEIQSFGGNFGGGVIQAAARGGAITYTSSSSFGTPRARRARTSTSRPGRLGLGTENITLPALSGSYPERRPAASLPALLRRSRRRPGQQRPPLPGHHLDRLPGRKPSAGRLGRPGGLPQLLHARQRRRQLPGRCSPRRPRRSNSRLRLRTRLRRRHARPLARWSSRPARR